MVACYWQWDYFGLEQPLLGACATPRFFPSTAKDSCHDCSPDFSTPVCSRSVYREKHHTYVCSLSLTGDKKRTQIEDEWLVVNDELMYRSDIPDQVERLGLPDLKKLDPLSSLEARERGILPEGYDYMNEFHKSLKAKYPQRNAFLRFLEQFIPVKIKKISRSPRDPRKS